MLHSGDAAFQFMRMTNIIMRLYKRGADPIHPRAPHGLSQKTRWDAFPSPRRPLPAPVGATRAAETSLLCNFASVLSRLSGPSQGPFPFSVELEILSLVFSFLFHSVWGGGLHRLRCPPPTAGSTSPESSVCTSSCDLSLLWCK